MEKAVRTMVKWGRVVFFDEQKFNLDGPDGLQYYLYDLRSDERLVSRRQGGGGPVIV